MSSSPRPAPVVSLERARAARATMDALAVDRDVFETFFESARIGLALADLTGSYVRVNDTYADLLGRPAEDLVGVPLQDVVGPPEPGAPTLPAGLADAVQVEREYVLQDGTVRWLLHGVATVLGHEGRPAWYAVSAQDVTERRRAEQDLRDQAEEMTRRAVRDPLTGLANRALLEERLRASLARDARSGEGTGALFLDLDDFKDVNDQHGHAVGDAVLRTVAERLVSAVRPSDTVARMGGDEFVVLVEGADEGALHLLEDRLTAAVQAPVHVGTLDLEVGVSIGGALSKGGEGDPPGLIAAADARMYDVKRTRT